MTRDWQVVSEWTVARLGVEVQATRGDCPRAHSAKGHYRVTSLCR